VVAVWIQNVVVQLLGEVVVAAMVTTSNPFLIGIAPIVMDDESDSDTYCNDDDDDNDDLSFQSWEMAATVKYQK
jgi:hypothetical protein